MSPGARIAQKKLAFEVTKDIHGEEAALEAVKMSNVLFSGEVQTLSKKEIEELLGGLKVKVEPSLSLLDLLVKVGAAQSKTQGKTFVLQNSVSINGVKATDFNKTYGSEDALFGEYLIIRRGKKNYYLAAL